jgi:hypothetical protein
MIGGGVGVAFAVTDTDDTALSHAGGFAQINLNYLLTDLIRVSLEPGFAFWYGIPPFTSYNGVILGLGIQLKY